MIRPGSRLLVVLMSAAVLLTSGAAFSQSEDPDQAARYRDGLSAFEAGDYDGAYVSWKPLAENGYAVAQYSLAKLYERGGGAILKNSMQAALWYRQAAAQGVAAAQNNLAIMYAKGDGVPKTPERAIELWREAAELGHPMAQYNLGLGYFNGDGVAVDQEAAVDWFLGAARAGVRDAQYALGQLYRQGVGVEPAEAEALYWYEQAAAQGHGEAGQEAAKLRERGVVASPHEDDRGVLLAQQEPAADAEPMASPEPSEALDESAKPSIITPQSGSLQGNESVLDQSLEVASEAGTSVTDQLDGVDEVGASGTALAVTDDQASPPMPKRRPESKSPLPPKKLPAWALDVPPPKPKRNPQLALAGTGAPEVGMVLGNVDFPAGSFSVWLASTSSPAEAERYWRQTASSHPEIFAGLTPRIIEVSLDDLGTYYRLTAGPLSDRETAQALCRRLRVHQPSAFCKVDSQ